MPNEKRSLHEVLSGKLKMATMGITRSQPGNPALVVDLLDSLFLGKMKAADAHSVAAEHSTLPEVMKDAGQTQIAELAEEVLADLKSRVDEKKPEESATPRQRLAGMDRDLPVRRGN